MRRHSALLLGIGISLAFGWRPASAQGSLACADTDTTAVARTPDVRIVASATAREVRFRSEPRLQVTTGGCAALDTVRVLERRNLPDPVRSDVTYRDVAVAVEILGHLDVTCLLDALRIPLVRADSAGARGSTNLARLCSPAPPQR